MTDKNGFHVIYKENAGEARINDGVLDTIAAVAAADVEGVASLRGSMTAEQITRSSSKSLSRSVKIESKDDKLHVHVVCSIKYGYSVPEVCKAVQEKVKESLQNMTGIDVAAVNVIVSEVQMEEPAKKKTVRKNAKEN